MKQQIFFSIFSPGKKIYTSCSINLCIFVACHICQAGFVPGTLYIHQLFFQAKPEHQFSPIIQATWLPCL